MLTILWALGLVGAMIGAVITYVTHNPDSKTLPVPEERPSEVFLATARSIDVWPTGFQYLDPTTLPLIINGDIPSEKEKVEIKEEAL